MKGAKNFRRTWIWFTLIAIALFMVSSGFGRTQRWNPVEEIVIEVTAPVQEFIRTTITTTRGVWLDYFYLVNVRRENRELVQEIGTLRMENSRFRDLLATYERLKRLLQFRETTHWPILAAQVTGRDPTGWFKSIIVDKGKRAGLKVDMPVVSSGGLVGRVVSVSPHYAKVLLIIDQNSAVDCLVQRSRDRGMVKGMARDICKMDYMVETADVKVGDMIVTSGLGGVYPKGLPIGKVTKVETISGELFKSILVQPLVDFSKLEEVLIILKENPSSNRPKEDT